MNPHRLTVRIGMVGAALSVVLTGCSAFSPSATSVSTTVVEDEVTQEAMDIGTLIDVRTPDEFAQGHLEGAINLDITSSAFDVEIANLDKAGTYTVYCRSGNRSAQAAERMRSIGIKNVTDAGGYEMASESLGLPTVKS